MRTIRTLTLVAIVLATVGCATFHQVDHKPNDLDAHVQLYNSYSSNPDRLIYNYESDFYKAELGNTRYFVEGSKEGTEEIKRKSTVNRTWLLGDALLGHWNKTGEHPVEVLRKFSWRSRNNHERMIDEKEFYMIMEYVGFSIDFYSEVMGFKI